MPSTGERRPGDMTVVPRPGFEGTGGAPAAEPAAAPAPDAEPPGGAVVPDAGFVGPAVEPAASDAATGPGQLAGPGQPDDSAPPAGDEDASVAEPSTDPPCRDGRTCTTEPTCKDRATCDIDCSAIERCGVKCEGGSQCTIDCTAAARCEEVECRRGAACVLYCRDSEPCRFKVCEGALAECPDGTIVCGRPCEL